MTKRKVIIDTDPGIDDLLALSIALASPHLDVLAISTVFGNVSLDNTSQNAVLIADIFEREIPIFKGIDKPLFYQNKNVSSVHGNDGLGNLRNKYRKDVKPLNKLNEGLLNLYQAIKNSDEKLTIIALGPLSNIAALLLVDESIKDNIEEIHIMGGSDRVGNTTELAEFNFYSDAYAAKIVLTSDIPIYLSSLDVTRKVYFSEEELELFPQDTFKQKFIKESVEYYASLDPFMHDVCSILTLTHPHLFTFKQVAMDVIVSSDVSDGMSYIIRDKTVERNNLNKNIYFADTDKRSEIIEYITKVIKENY